MELRGCGTDRDTIASVERVLTLEFFVEAERQRYGSPLIEMVRGQYRLTDAVERLLAGSDKLRKHVDDVIATGLYLARHRHGWRNGLQIGQTYTRKDVCRLLNWRGNEMSTLYGYKVDAMTNTCPIFVTYHKKDDLIESVRYEDEFLDASTLRWFTRSRRTLESGEVRSITGGKVPLHLFAKKDDAEGRAFTYLGPPPRRTPVRRPCRTGTADSTWSR